jgi:hypothetical protein
MEVDGTSIDNDYVVGLSLPTGVAVDGTYVYWTQDGDGPLAIGRAQIGAVSAVGVQPDFIAEPGGPTGLAVDSAIDSTATTVSCAPASVPAALATTCTATVTDSASASVPTGTVQLTGNGATLFTGDPCTLAPKPGGGASCAVSAVPTLAGTQQLQATYSGDQIHSSSTGTVTLCAGAGSPCGRGCTVPKLAGKAPEQARKLLAAAHCALGNQTKPKRRRGHKPAPLVVGSQSIRPGTHVAAGTKVAVHLVPVQARRNRA